MLKYPLLFLITCSLSAKISFNMHSTANNLAHGLITCIDNKFGLICKLDLNNIKPGPHGIHVHSNNSCQNKGLAALGHLQRAGENHLGPYATKGHLGDLPEIYANANGTVKSVILAPRLTEKDLNETAIIIHEFGDNYSDQPTPLGGGGSRIACGIARK